MRKITLLLATLVFALVCFNIVVTPIVGDTYTEETEETKREAISGLYTTFIMVVLLFVIVMVVIIVAIYIVHSSSQKKHDEEARRLEEQRRRGEISEETYFRLKTDLEDRHHSVLGKRKSKYPEPYQPAIQQMPPAQQPYYSQPPMQQQPPQSTMYCPSCGRAIPADAAVCPYCGDKVVKR